MIMNERVPHVQSIVSIEDRNTYTGVAYTELELRTALETAKKLKQKYTYYVKKKRF